jgi:hypothetical protein
MQVMNTPPAIQTNNLKSTGHKNNKASFKDSMNVNLGKVGREELSAKDESDAAYELFKLTKMLISGIVDYNLLGEADAIEGTRQGKKRELVEKLKMAIKCIIKETKPENGSLTDLIGSFPSEIQELLHSAFPNLKEMIELEKEKAAKKRAEKVEQEQNGEDYPEEQITIETLNLLRENYTKPN